LLLPTLPPPFRNKPRMPERPLPPLLHL
jgi:hypothetical protein